MRLRLVVFLCAVPLLAVTGCASARTDVAPATQSPLEPSLAPSIAESAPPETIDPTDPSTWTISAAGIGPITLGQSVDDATLALAAFTAQAVPCDNPNYRMFRLSDALGLTIATQDGVTVRGVAITTDFASVATVSSPRTAEGLGLGSTVEEVQAAYPEAVEQSGSSEYIHVADGGIWISFSPEFGDAPGMLSVDVAQGWSLPSEYC